VTQPASHDLSLAERRLAKLEVLADVGLHLAQALERHVVCAEAVQLHQAKTDPDSMMLPACDLSAIATAYNRIARAVRMTFALQERLERRAHMLPCADRRLPRRPDARPEDFEDETRAIARGLRESAEHLFDGKDAPGLLPSCLCETPALSPPPSPHAQPFPANAAPLDEPEATRGARPSPGKAELGRSNRPRAP
jgi:hypothetical protein